MRFSTASVALVASASAALAGKAVVVNNCDFDAQVVSVADQAGPVQKLAAHGGRYEETYKTRSNGAGTSVKVSRNGGGDVAQFEYTLNSAGLWWDLSLIDGTPFANSMLSIVPTILSKGEDATTCQTVTCPEGKNCASAYLKWNDDLATHHCPAETDLTYYLCSNGPVSSSAPASSPAPAPAHSEAPASSPAPSPAPSPSPSPAPAPAPSPAAASPAPVQAQQKAADTPAASPVPVAAPVSPKSGFALSWQEGSNRLVETPLKREVGHANHLERHNRIRRMHHARSVA